MKRFFLSVIVLFATSSAIALPVRMDFFAAGFDNAGTQIPGFSGPISGSISWNANDLDDPVLSLIGIDFTLYGHTFTLGQVGFTNSGNNTVFGGTANGVNAVVGNGSATDFLFIFDHQSGQLNGFAYSLQGMNNSIWWTPDQVDVRISSISGVPEPSSAALLALGVLALGVSMRRH